MQLLSWFYMALDLMNHEICVCVCVCVGIGGDENLCVCLRAN